MIWAKQDWESSQRVSRDLFCAYCTGVQWNGRILTLGLMTLRGAGPVGMPMPGGGGGGGMPPIPGGGGGGGMPPMPGGGGGGGIPPGASGGPPAGFIISSLSSALARACSAALASASIFAKSNSADGPLFLASSSALDHN